MASVAHLLRAVLLVVMPVLAFPSQAALATSIIGGPGGAPFADRPPTSGARIAAVMVGSGSWIDAVQVLYQAPDGSRVPSARHGGNGGGPGVFALEPDERIVAISGHYGQYVNAIQVHTDKRRSRVYGAPGGTPFRIDVPPGHVAVGFAGRAGVYLDAIGLALAPQALPRDIGPGVPPHASTPAPSTPSANVALVRAPSVRSSVQPNGNRADALLTVDLTAPAPIELVLGDYNPGTHRCFPASYRPVLRASQPVSQRHVVTIRNLQMGNTYHYAIRIGSGKCESGSFTTATLIDRP